MKKIAVISYHTCPLSSQEGKEVGGMNIYVLELSKRLVKIGYSIDIFTRQQDSVSEKIVEISKNLRVIHIKAGPQKDIEKKELIRYIPEFVDNLNGFVKKNSLSYDLIDCHYYMSGIAGVNLGEKWNIPFAITFHTLALMKNLVAKTDQEKESIERIYAEKLLAKRAAIVISPSETDKEYLKFLYGCEDGKIAIVSPGVDTKKFSPIDKNLAKEKIGFHKNGKLILFVGRIEPLKGIDVLLYSMKMLVEKNPQINVYLWIVGGDTSKSVEFWPEELKRLEELRGILGLKSSVKFVGRKKPEELPFYYNAAEFLIGPSQYESFGMTALESMSCGIPVITTDVTGVSDLFDEKHQTLVSSANNPLHLEQIMENLLIDDKFHEKVSREVFERVQDLDWENVAKCIDFEFESLSKNG